LNTDHLRHRQVHLDFHTGPAIKGVGADFNASAFAQTLKDSHVDSITLFAKCHHGHLYYETNRPERHPGLAPGLDLLGEQIEACRSAGIRTPIYLSVMCDEYAANLNPGWVCLNPDGSRVGRKPMESNFGAWQILDMSSPYADFLAEQIDEVVRKYGATDGIFLDMCWDQPSVSNWANAGMAREGLNPLLESDRGRYATGVVRGYMERYNKLIADASGNFRPRVWYNSRPKTELLHEAKFLRHIEIEALPTGGWGYTYFPLNVRWARNFGLPFIGMTARFHKSWSDFGGYKPHAALKYEVCQMLAHGGGCSVGDQLHPRGALDVEAYRRIGQAYAHVKAVEPWCIGATPVTDVAVLRDPVGSYHVAPGDTLEGVVQLLQQLAVQFDLVAPDADLSKYRLIFVLNNVSVAGDTGERLLAFIQSGGKLILAGADAIASAPKALQTATGVSEIEPGTAGIKLVYFRYDRAKIPDAEQSDVVCYDGTPGLIPATGAVMPAVIVEPYFQRSWDRFCGHGQTPPATPLQTGPATIASGGAAIAFDVFKAYAEHGQEHVRGLVRFIISQLLPDPLIKTDLPSHAEVTVTKQPGRTMVHMLSYAPQRRTPTLDIVESATPLVNRRLSLKLPVAPKQVTRQPAGEVMKMEYADGYASVVLNSSDGHDVLVFEM
jgi:hypothetical protein